MTTYTAEDFANAEFARHQSGVVAARFYDRGGMPWLTADEISLSNEDMADLGWVPVREAAAHPITLDALRDAWEGAEVVTEDEPIRDGDLIIEHHAGMLLQAWGVFEANQSWAGDYQDPSVRILHRAPKPKRPEGAETLEALLDEWDEKQEALLNEWGDPTRDEEPTSLADWLAERLAERGVRVTEEGEK